MSVTDAIRIRTADDVSTIAANFCKPIFKDYEIKTWLLYDQLRYSVDKYPFSIDVMPSRPAIVSWAEHYIDDFGFIQNFSMPIFYSRKAQDWIQVNGGWDMPVLRNVVLQAVLEMIKSTDYSLVLELDEPEREVLIRHDGKLTLLDDHFWTEERLRSFADIPYETGKLPRWLSEDTLYIKSRLDLETITRRFCEQAFEDFHIDSNHNLGTNTAVIKAVSKNIEVKTVGYSEKYRPCHYSHQQNLGFVPNTKVSISYGSAEARDEFSPDRDAIFAGALGLIRTTNSCLVLRFSPSSGSVLQYKPGLPPSVAKSYLSEKRLRLLGDTPYIVKDVLRFTYYPA